MKNQNISTMGGIIAIILLLLYSAILGYMIFKVISIGHTGTTDFHSGITNIVTIIGGLISALVIAQLAITPPKANPGRQIALNMGAENSSKSIYAFIVNGYLYIWLGLGLVSLIIGVVFFPETDKTVAEIGTTWLGLAVASGYSYLKLDPNT